MVLLLLSFRKDPEKVWSLETLEHQSLSNLAAEDFRRGASPEHGTEHSNTELLVCGTVRGDGRVNRTGSSLPEEAMPIPDHHGEILRYRWMWTWVWLQKAQYCVASCKVTQFDCISVPYTNSCSSSQHLLGMAAKSPDLQTGMQSDGNTAHTEYKYSALFTV